MFARIEIAGALFLGFAKKIDSLLRLASFDGHVAEVIERGEVVRIGGKSLLEFGLSG